jgi:CIC family chloride channel protein
VPTFGWVFPILFSSTGAVIAIIVVSRCAPEAAGSGIPHLKAVLHRLRDLTWCRVLLVKMASGVVAIGSGLALGREGPSVHMGGAVADGIARGLKVSTQDRLTLTAAGAGAGLAAAFNAPLSGLVFVLEEVQRDFRPAVFGAAFLAAAMADVVSRFVSGQLPVFKVPTYAMPPLVALPAFAVLGLAAGALGILFNRGLIGTMNLFARVQRWKLEIGAAVGAITGLVAWFLPSVVGGGHSVAETVLSGSMSLVAVLAIFLLRFGLTVSSYGVGTAGGIFAPLLALGALLGAGVGIVAHDLMPRVVAEPGMFSVVGMAAYFTAIVRAPLTGVLLITEMTGSYEQMLPLLISCFCAYAVTEFFRDMPIYEALLERDLAIGGIAHSHTEPIVLELQVDDGAPFVGKSLRELGLPAGCVLVRCVFDGREWVPTADTLLEAHMRITAVIAPEASGALEQLRRGCASTEKDRATE